jgi:DNA-binding winged helix-turn-helix (wHTH) protein
LIVKFSLAKKRAKRCFNASGFDVLTFLIKNAGRVVEKQEIFDAVWKDTFVGDNALTKVVKEIRHVLEDAADAPRYIETVPKRGYRFIGELKEFYEQIAPEVEKSSTNEIVIEEDELNERNLQSPPETTSPRFVFSKPALVLSVASLISISVLVTWSLFRKILLKLQLQRFVR